MMQRQMRANAAPTAAYGCSEMKERGCMPEGHMLVGTWWGGLGGLGGRKHLGRGTLACIIGMHMYLVLYRILYATDVAPTSCACRW